MAVAAHPTIPEAKPAFELIDDRLCQKVSPKYDHARLQGHVDHLLRALGREHGRVGIEWRFTFDGPEGRPQSLVPDVGFLSFERIGRERRSDAQEPEVAPDIAVEVLSPSDWRGHVERKCELYLAAGTTLVIEIDPGRRTVAVHDRTHTRNLVEPDVLEHPAFPWLHLSVSDIFAALDDP